MVALQVLVVGLGLGAASAAQVELKGGSWALEVTLDPSYPKGTLTRDGASFRLLRPKLSLRTTEARGALVTTEYRLQFAVDQCAHAKPTPPGEWPGPCAYPDGAAPPLRLQWYDVLITKKQLRGADARVDYAASCVPATGEGPSCRLEGTSPTADPKTAAR